MEKELNELFESAKKSKKGIRALKMAAISANCFDVAAKLRDVENDLFPDSPEQKEANTFANDIKTALAMSGINTDASVAWLIGKTVYDYKAKKGKFSLRDAAEIMVQHEKLWKNDDAR